MPWLSIATNARPEPGQPPTTHASKIRVQGQVFGSLRADPDTFRAGAKPGKRFTRTIRLFHADAKAFEVLSVQPLSQQLADLDVRAEPSGDRTSWNLVLTATAPAQQRVLSGQVDIRTDVPGEESISVKISGSVRK